MAQLMRSASVPHLVAFCLATSCAPAAAPVDVDMDVPAPDAATDDLTNVAQGPQPIPDAATADLAVEWSKYTIDPGAHIARVDAAMSGAPLQFLTTVSGRDFDLRFNPSAIYVITSPVQPNDQLDWNKLPGFSDCTTLDLQVSGAMFGWRWRPEMSLLEITAYANDDSHHLNAGVLVTLDSADLTSDEPLRYRLWADGAVYHFSIHGTVRGRAIDADTTLPRACPTVSTSGIKWAGELYFGGTSAAPSQVTALVTERTFVP
jgi:hypothetical protein